MSMHSNCIVSAFLVSGKDRTATVANGGLKCMVNDMSLNAMNFSS